MRQTVCGVRIYEVEGQPPIILVTQLPQTKGTIEKQAPFLAAGILLEYLPDVITSGGKFRYIEQGYFDADDLGDSYMRNLEFSEVDFSGDTLHRDTLRTHGNLAFILGNLFRHREFIARQEVENLIGPIQMA